MSASRIFLCNIRDSKSLIKHLLAGDISKRYGCLKNGVKDIIDHRFFKDFDWRGLLFMTLEVPYVPKIKYYKHYNQFRNSLDTSNFSHYPDSDTDVNPMKLEKDPFLNW
jgi:protein kinase A/protein kinase X